MSLSKLLSEYSPIDVCGPESKYIIPGYLFLSKIEDRGGLSKFKMPGQRPLIEEYVQSLYEQQKKFYTKNGYFSLMRTQITIGHCSCSKCNGNESLLDGQHRVSCLLRLFKELPADFAMTDQTIDINYIKSSHEKLRERFVVMAKNNQPISKMYTDDPIKTITEALWNKFMVDNDQFSKFISISAKSAKRPNLRQIDFENKFSNSQYLSIVTDSCDNNPEAVVNNWIDIFNQFNKHLADDKNYLSYAQDVTEGMYDTAFISEFYLGLIPYCKWIDHAYEYHIKLILEESKKKRRVNNPIKFSINKRDETS